MNQLNLRRMHRAAGLISAFFILLQSGTGIFLSLRGLSVSSSHAHSEPLTVSPDHEKEQSTDMQQKPGESSVTDQHVRVTGVALWQKISADLHHGGGFLVSVYRILLGVSLIFMALSGSTIFYLTRKTTKK